MYATKTSQSANHVTLSPIRFGTDGWRAVIGDQFTFANLERVTQAYVRYLTENAGSAPTAAPHIVIGYDRRFLSMEFAQRAADVIGGNGLQVLLFDEDVPTPLVSWAVRDTGALGGIVITASHNPPEFNGFKVKADFGGSAPGSMTKAIEECLDLDQPVPGPLVTNAGRTGADNTISSYREQIANYVDLDRIRSSDISLVIDPMHGSGGTWVESFLKSGNINAETIRGWRDPLFGGINPEPIDSNLGPLKERILSNGAALGLATDGDADRLGAVNELGHTMTMHEVVPLMLLHLIRNRKMTGGVVTTFSQSVLVKRIAERFGLRLFETPIGFKYIADLMLTENILMGAEESGGIGVMGHIPERDGILNSLLLLEAVIAGGKAPSELVKDIHREFGSFYYKRVDIKMDIARGQDLARTMAERAPRDVAGHKVSHVETIDGTKLIFQDESWLLLRQSGTEPVLRIYAEATSPQKAHDLIQEARSLTA